jgi:hypothetical protein
MRGPESHWSREEQYLWGLENRCRCRPTLSENVEWIASGYDMIQQKKKDVCEAGHMYT